MKRTLDKTHPHLIKEWDYNKNKECPSSFTYGSGMIMHWICSKNHEWKTTIHERTRKDKGSSCPYCSNHRLCKENCLVNNDLYGICKEWDYTKNEKTPYDYSKSSKDKAHWICKNNHEWQATINNRNNKTRHRGCPYCNGKKVNEENCLASNDKNNICKDWDYDKNEKSSYDYVVNSNKEVFWKCVKNSNHTWKAKICTRVRHPNCPFCVGQRVSLDNSLANNDNNNICQEWNYEKNKKTPYDYTSQSGASVWWKCIMDNSHEWQTAICHRNKKNGKGSNCPVCLISKGEKLIEEYLKYKDYEFEREKSFDDLKYYREFRFDFYIPTIKTISKDLSIAIEFDGIQHFDKKNYYHNNSSFDQREMYDLMKTNYCFDNKICLIRISYDCMDDI